VRAADMASRVSTIKGAEVLRLRGKLLPLVRMSKLLGVPKNQTNASANGLEVIVVEGGSVRFGMIVDGLEDSEEIVVKPLGQHLKSSTCLAGAAVLGDGEVALILDAAGIAAFAALAKTSDEESEELAKSAGETQATLLFTNHASEIFGIPMAVIKRVERIDARQIDLIGGQLIYEYENGSLPLIALEEQIRALPREKIERIYVAIFEFNTHEIAVIVPSLSEIRELPLDIDTRTFREPGVIGSVVMDKQAIRLLDVFQLAAKAYPQLAQQEVQAVTTTAPSSYRILVAEDSAFFRSQVISFLESKGYEVVGAADGELGWETLQEADPPIDLVLTDIEMPNLNGFEFCERIRRSDQFGELPVIALTSLAGEEDMERGRLVGVSDYQVKMDRDRLLAAVARLLKGASRAQRELALV
jgi:two-component system chemotaxis sensor kinase CheA